MPGAVVAEACDADLEGVRITVEEEGEKGGYVYFVFAEVKSVDTDNGAPETGNDASSEDDGEGPGNTSESTINQQLNLSPWTFSIECTGSCSESVLL